VTDFLAARRYFFFVVITGGPPQNRARSPMVRARRSWKMADFPRAAIGRTIFLSVPSRTLRASRPFIAVVRSLVRFFTFRAFRLVFPPPQLLVL